MDLNARIHERNISLGVIRRIHEEVCFADIHMNEVDNELKIVQLDEVLRIFEEQHTTVMSLLPTIDESNIQDFVHLQEVYFYGCDLHIEAAARLLERRKELNGEPGYGPGTCVALKRKSYTFANLGCSCVDCYALEHGSIESAVLDEDLTIAAGFEGDQMMDTIESGTKEQRNGQLQTDHETVAALEDELRRLRMELATDKSRYAHTEEMYKSEIMQLKESVVRAEIATDQQKEIVERCQEEIEKMSLHTVRFARSERMLGEMKAKRLESEITRLAEDLASAEEARRVAVNDVTTTSNKVLLLIDENKTMEYRICSLEKENQRSCELLLDSQRKNTLMVEQLTADLVTERSNSKALGMAKLQLKRQNKELRRKIVKLENQLNVEAVKYETLMADKCLEEIGMDEGRGGNRLLMKDMRGENSVNREDQRLIPSGDFVDFVGHPEEDVYLEICGWLKDHVGIHGTSFRGDDVFVVDDKLIDLFHCVRGLMRMMIPADMERLYVRLKIRAGHLMRICVSVVRPCEGLVARVEDELVVGPGVGTDVRCEWTVVEDLCESQVQCDLVVGSPCEGLSASSKNGSVPGQGISMKRRMMVKGARSLVFDPGGQKNCLGGIGGPGECEWVSGLDEWTEQSPVYDSGGSWPAAGVACLPDEWNSCGPGEYEVEAEVDKWNGQSVVFDPGGIKVRVLVAALSVGLLLDRSVLGIWSRSTRLKVDQLMTGFRIERWTSGLITRIGISAHRTLDLRIQPKRASFLGLFEFNGQGCRRGLECLSMMATLMMVLVRSCQ